MVQSIFRYLELFRRDSRLASEIDRRTVGRTDILVANAALNYVAEQKTASDSRRQCSVNLTLY